MGDCCGQGRAPERRRSVWADVSARPLPGRTPLGGQKASAGGGASRFRRAPSRVVAAKSGVVRDDGGEPRGDMIVGALCELVAPGVVRPVVDGSAAPVEQDEQRHAITAIKRQLLRLVLDFRWGGLWPSRARNCLETKGKKWATNVAARRIAINGISGSLSKPSCLRASGHLERRGHMRKPCNCGNLYRSLAPADECSSGDPAASPNALRARLRPTRDGRGHIAPGHGNSLFSRSRTRTRAGLRHSQIDDRDPARRSARRPPRSPPRLERTLHSISASGSSNAISHRLLIAPRRRPRSSSTAARPPSPGRIAIGTATATRAASRGSAGG